MQLLTDNIILNTYPSLRFVYCTGCPTGYGALWVTLLLTETESLRM